MLTLLYLQENNNKCLQSENQHVYSDIMDFFLKKKKVKALYNLKNWAREPRVAEC